MTKMLAQFLLLRAENAILEVQDDDDDGQEEERHSNPPKKDDADKQDDNEHNPPRENGGDGEIQPESSNVTKKPISLSLTEARMRRNEDDFGQELPDTPGGWKEEWHLLK
jgi:hypothetical protein